MAFLIKNVNLSFRQYESARPPLPPDHNDRKTRARGGAVTDPSIIVIGGRGVDFRVQLNESYGLKLDFPIQTVRILSTREMGGLMSARILLVVSAVLVFFVDLHLATPAILQPNERYSFDTRIV